MAQSTVDFAAQASRFIDGLIEPFAPERVRRRMAERLALAEMRQYDAAARGRRTDGWKRTGGSADREIRGALPRLRNGARELVRNNKYAASAVRQIAANVVGDGITARMTHKNKAVARKAQEEWDRTAESRLDGREDHYGQQKMLIRAVVEGGEGLAIWNPDERGPDGRCFVVEGDLLDHTKEVDRLPNGGCIVQGVEYDAAGFRCAFWLFDKHPGDGRGYVGQSRRFDARHVDHVFEALRPGQTRGVSWFAPVAMDLRDGGDYEDAILMKRKVEACLALVLTPPDSGGPSSPFDEVRAEGAAGAEGGRGRGTDRIRPGMVFRARPGETATSLNPSSGGDGVDFMRMKLKGVAANLVPYFLMTGDASQANYSSQRAQMLGFWANLDDWQQNMMVPHFCQPAVMRCMRRLAMKTGDARYLDVKPQFAMPVRRLLDPTKDLLAMEMELRLGSLSYPDMLSARGLDPDQHLKAMAEFNDLVDRLGLVLDGDPRKTARSGALQPPAGFARPRDDSED